MDGKDLQISTELYWDHTAAVSTQSGVSSEIEINKKFDKIVYCYLACTQKRYFERWRNPVE